MKHTLKLITLLTLGTLSATVMAQVPQQAVKTPQASIVTGNGTKVDIPVQTVNDYSNIGDGNAYEKAVTPLLREISRKKSILEIKKLDKEIAKLEEVEKKDTPPTITAPMMQPPLAMNNSQANTNISMEEENSTPVKVLMTYGAEDDLYAKIAVGDQGGYTVRKGDILPDGRSVLKVNSNYIEVQKAVTKKSNKKSKTEKIFVSAGTTTAPATPNMQNRANNMPMGGAIPSIMPIPGINSFTGSNQPLR